MLDKIKDGAHVINLDEYINIGTYWIALYLNGDKGESSNTTTYLHSFEIKRIPQETTKSIGNKNFTTNMFRLQA